MTIEDRNNRIIELLPVIRVVAFNVAHTYRRMLQDDLTQDIVVYLLGKTAEYLLYAEKPLFRRAIKCRCLDFIKSKQYNNSWANRIPHQSWHQDPPGEVEAVYIEDDCITDATLQQIRSLLSDRDWMFVAGVDLYGYTQDELGKILGCHRSFVSKRRLQLMPLIRDQMSLPIDKREVIVTRRRRKLM